VTELQKNRTKQWHVVLILTPTCVVQEVGVCWVHALLQPEGVVNWQLTHGPLDTTADLHNTPKRSE
jgi:hypothetical protein